MGATISTARPSFDGIAGETPESTPSAFVRCATVAAAKSRAVESSFDEPVSSTIAGIASESENSFTSFCTLVASALAGRNVVWSFDETSSTRPK